MAAKQKPVLYSAAQIAPIMLLCGPEQALQSAAAEIIKTRLQTNHPDLAIHDLTAAECRRGELVSLASPSLFGEPRLIRVAGFEKADAGLLEELQKIGLQLGDDTFVMLSHAGGNTGKSALTAVRKLPGVVEVDCAKVKPGERATVLQTEAKRRGLRVTAEAQRALLEAFNDDFGELFAAVAQLGSSCSGPVQVSDVERITAGRVETTVFAVADAALDGNPEQTILLLRHALQTGIDPVAVQVTVARGLRELASVFGRRSKPAELASELGVPWWRVEKAQRRARRWGEVSLARVTQLATTTEEALKGGARDREFALEKLLLAVATRGSEGL